NGNPQLAGYGNVGFPATVFWIIRALWIILASWGLVFAQPQRMAAFSSVLFDFSAVNGIGNLYVP
ncbi:MAG: hypothetical protein LBW85_03220, partial [Deltaproteobacteria bacterium]|nr:hypothetical protein [Deltaproteobacteria bacterium]